MKHIQKRILIILLSLLFISVSVILVSYLYVIPKVVCSPKTISFVQKILAENCNAELLITNPVLKTSLNSDVSFSTPSVTLTKDGDSLLNLQNFDIEINLSKLLLKKIKIKKLGADEIYIDVNKLQNLKIKENKNENGSGKLPFSFDCFNTLFYVKKCAVLYETKNGVKTKLLAKDLEVSQGNEPKMLHFAVYLDLYHKDKHLRLFFKEKDNVFFKDRKLQAHDFKFRVNKSDIILNAFLDEKHHYNVNLKSDKFEIENINRLLSTNLVIPNGTDITNCFKNYKGDFNFDITLTDKDINGLMKINKISADLTPVADLPLTVTKGLVSFNSKDIDIKDFEGFYGAKSQNKAEMSGKVTDYTKTADTKITIKGIANDELATYISKLAGMKISIIKNAVVNLDVLANVTGKTDVKGTIGFNSGSDILFEGASISPVKFYREIDMDLSLVKDILSINHINYYIDKKAGNVQPLVRVKGSMNAFTGFLRELSFDVPKPLPSEFFNVLVGQNVLRRGTFSGKMTYKNIKKPCLEGKMELKDTAVTGQFFLIKNMTLEAENDNVKIVSDGYIRRAKYDFDADIVNNIAFPITVKNIKLSFDEIDAEKIMRTFAPRPPRTANNTKRPSQNTYKFAESEVPKEYFVVEQSVLNDKSKTASSEQIAFQPDLIEIKNCLLNIKKGIYKQINFGNLNANLTLTKKGILEIKSNKFDFAEGISSLNVNCDLLKELYAVRLEAKAVDTDAIAASILNLSKEITGKASASMDFNTNSGMKLNGNIKFEILDGSITKLGLVQYLLNMASVFRNPLAMISPSTLVDLVNVPDGSFNRINGRLKITDNNVSRMMIKSSSKQLSAFITGNINLENSDASLRIYTKFNNKNIGIWGFLRGFSLNSIAQKASKHTKENRENYYASELAQLPPLETGEDTAQVFLTQIDGDIQSTNFLSSLKKIK